jgi:UDP-N-acetylmuramate-alanine ligase
MIQAKLKPGDIFLTMGAGDNWKLGRALAALLEDKESVQHGTERKHSE